MSKSTASTICFLELSRSRSWRSLAPSPSRRSASATWFSKWWLARWRRSAGRLPRGCVIADSTRGADAGSARDHNARFLSADSGGGSISNCGRSRGVRAIARYGDLWSPDGSRRSSRAAPREAVVACGFGDSTACRCRGRRALLFTIRGPDPTVAPVRPCSDAGDRSTPVSGGRPGGPCPNSSATRPRVSPLRALGAERHCRRPQRQSKNSNLIKHFRSS